MILEAQFTPDVSLRYEMVELGKEGTWKVFQMVIRALILKLLRIGVNNITITIIGCLSVQIWM